MLTKVVNIGIIRRICLKEVKILNIKNSPYPYAFCTSVFWSLAYVLTRICKSYLNPVHIGVLRATIGMITLLIVVFVLKMPLPRKKDFKWFLLAGVSGIFIYMISFNLGCTSVTTATGNVILAVAPAVTALGATVFFKEHLRGFQWIAIGISFVGVLILCLMNGGFSINVGILWLLLSMFLMSVYNLMQRYLSKSYPSLSVTAFSFAFGVVELGLFAPQAYVEIFHVPAKIVLLVLVLGVVCSGLSYCTWTIAFSKAKNASTVSNFMFINPFISTFFATILIGDPIESSALIGGGVIMIGMFLFNFGEKFIKAK